MTGSHRCDADDRGHLGRVQTLGAGHRLGHRRSDHPRQRRVDANRR